MDRRPFSAPLCCPALWRFALPFEREGALVFWWCGFCVLRLPLWVVLERFISLGLTLLWASVSRYLPSPYLYRNEITLRLSEELRDAQRVEGSLNRSQLPS
jgi:hypothetical protein